MQIIDALCEEHRLIIRAAYLCIGIASCKNCNPDLVHRSTQQLCTFFEDFQIELHRRKEEDVLFTWLISVDPSTVDVVDTLLADHAFSRELLDELFRIAHSEVSSSSAATLQELHARYGRYLVQHITREEQLLFPMARLLLQGDTENAVQMVCESPQATISVWQNKLDTLNHFLEH